MVTDGLGMSRLNCGSRVLSSSPACFVLFALWQDSMYSQCSSSLWRLIGSLEATKKPGDNLLWTSTPTCNSINILSRFMLQIARYAPTGIRFYALQPCLNRFSEVIFSLCCRRRANQCTNLDGLDRLPRSGAFS